MRVFAKVFAAVGLAVLLAPPVMAQAQDAPIVRLSGTLAKVHDAGEIALGYRADSFPFSYLDVANNPDRLFARPMRGNCRCGRAHDRHAFGAYQVRARDGAKSVPDGDVRRGRPGVWRDD